MHPGDEVTISYFGDLSGRKDLRQKTLGVAWHFLRSCPRCTVEEGLHWKTQSAIHCLNTEADKYNSHDPDKYLYSYRYSASPAFIAPFSQQSVKCVCDTSPVVFSLAMFALHCYALHALLQRVFIDSSVTYLLSFAV